MPTILQLRCLASRVALAGLAFNAFVLVAAPIARPDLDLSQYALSYYAIGPWGMLQAAAFVAMGSASLALAVALRWSRDPSSWMQICVSMLLLGGIGSLGLVLFPMGAPGPETLLGDAHQTAGTLAGVAHLAAALAFIIATRFDSRWNDETLPATAAFITALLGSVLTQASIWWPGLGLPMGAVMRLAVVPLVLLWGWVALRLTRRCC